MSERVGEFCGALVVDKTLVASFDESDLEKTLAKKLFNSSHFDKVDSAHAGIAGIRWRLGNNE